MLLDWGRGGLIPSGRRWCAVDPWGSGEGCLTGEPGVLCSFAEQFAGPRSAILEWRVGLFCLAARRFSCCLACC